MHALVADQNQSDRNHLCAILKQMDPQGVFYEAASFADAKAYVLGQNVKAAFLGIGASNPEGLKLAVALRQNDPEIGIIFLAEDESDAFRAFQIYADAYLLKPADLPRITEALSKLRHPLEGEKPAGIVVQCFGEFEVFFNGEVMAFSRARTKELFAALVCHRGASLSMGELLAILWEDGEDTTSNRSYLRTLIHDLRQTFDGVGEPEAVKKTYNAIAVNPARISCDYYDFLEGRREAVLKYQGVFMRQYSWAEYEFNHDY